jgi:DNA-directed RNA polymerase specialized sigma subunit
MIDKYTKTEEWLYKLDALKERIKNLKMQYEETELKAQSSGIDYSKDKLSNTYAFNSSTENIGIKLAEIQQEIKEKENRITMLESGLNILNETERIIVINKYFKNEPWWKIAYICGYSESQAKRKRNYAIDKLSVALFGE